MLLLCITLFTLGSTVILPWTLILFIGFTVTASVLTGVNGSTLGDDVTGLVDVGEVGWEVARFNICDNWM